MGSSPEYDVVILGGGPAGSATALSLLARGLDPTRLLVVEASDYARERIGESIPPDTRQPLAELGVLEAFLTEGHEPCHGSASCWGSNALGHNDFMLNPFGSGWHLDRRRFDAWLAGEVVRRGVEVRTRQRFVDVPEHGALGAVLRVRASAGEARRVRARFVVDATGPRSLYASRLGATRRELDRLVSVAAFFTLPTGAAFPTLTYLEAVEYGWWYTARLPGRRIAAAVATSHALHKERRFDRPRAWLEALARTTHVRDVLAECAFVPNRASICVAPSFILDRAYGAHWLAVGDAASAYDPISSQGIYKALTDGLVGGRTIAAHLSGAAEALVEHQAQLETRFEQYAAQRAYLYERERRWFDAPFWRERRAARPPQSGGRVAIGGLR